MKAFVSVGGLGGPLFFASAALAVMLSPLEAATQQPPNILVIMCEMLMKTEGNN